MSRFIRDTMRSPWSAQRSQPLTGNRALSLLADNPDGCTVPIVLAHGFSIELVNQLIRARLVSARTKAHDKPEVYRDRLVHMEITNAGRRVLVDSDQPALTDARPKPRVADNLDDGPAPLGPLIGGKGLETIPTKQTLVDPRAHPRPRHPRRKPGRLHKGHDAWAWFFARSDRQPDSRWVRDRPCAQPRQEGGRWHACASRTRDGACSARALLTVRTSRKPSKKYSARRQSAASA